MQAVDCGELFLLMLSLAPTIADLRDSPQQRSRPQKPHLPSMCRESSITRDFNLFSRQAGNTELIIFMERNGGTIVMVAG
jgi:hypothetical protein